MKKFFIMMAIAGALASCNDSSTSTTSPEDSARIADSTRRATEMNNPMPMNPSDSMNNMNSDTMNRGMRDSGSMNRTDSMK